eukprot:352362-Chlamydomonas_euryale.AAC.2
MASAFDDGADKPGWRELLVWRREPLVCPGRRELLVCPGSCSAAGSAAHRNGIKLCGTDRGATCCRVRCRVKPTAGCQHEGGAEDGQAGRTRPFQLNTATPTTATLTTSPLPPPPQTKSTSSLIHAGACLFSSLPPHPTPHTLTHCRRWLMRLGEGAPAECCPPWASRLRPSPATG